MGKGHRTCEVCGIKERHTGNKLLFSKFPLDTNRCREWLRAVGNEELVYLPVEKLHDQRNVCAKHFGKKDFNKKRNRLKRHAIPTLNLMASPLTESQLAEFPQHVFRSTEPEESTLKSNKTQAVGDDQKENILEVQTESVPEAVPSTSTGSGLRELCKNNEALIMSLKRTGGPIEHAAKSRRVSQTKSIPDARENATLSVKQSPQIATTTQDGLTPREKKLLEQLRKTKCNMSSLRRSANILENLESTVLKEFVESAFKNQKKKPTGRRWTSKNKISALAIFKRSPKAYRYLQHLMPLPSIRTLQSVLKKIPVATGINKAVMDHLKKMSPKKDIKDKYCALLFDEIALKRRLLFDPTSDIVQGYEDFGSEYGRSSQLADHALVFMLQGVRAKFKQPVAFFFVKGTVSSQKLATLIKKIIVSIKETGFNVITTICDQGPTNMGALKILRTNPPHYSNENHFDCDGQKIYIIYDVPHLFKSLRNNFYKYGQMSMCGKIAKWEHLLKAEEKNRNLLYLSKITAMHVQPKYRAKMKVKYAAQILSNTVAAVVKLMAQSQTDPLIREEMMQTGTIVNDLDCLFDKTNGPSCPDDVKRGRRENVSRKTDHVQAWVEYRAKLETVVFRNSNGIKAKNVRCIEGYITTLKSLRDIWSDLSSRGFLFLNLRQLNQDALENLFGLIRQHSPTNRNPTCFSFIGALKTSIISGMTAPHNRGSNCEKDFKNLLTDFHSEVFQDSPNTEELSKNSTPELNTSQQVGTNVIIAQNFSQDIPVLSIPEEFEAVDTDLTEMEQQPIVYISGYIASIILKHHKCKSCENDLMVEDPDNDPMFSYIKLREWWPEKLSLTYPTKNLCRLVETACLIFEREIIPSLHQINICQLTTTIFTANCDAEFLTCVEHENMIKSIIYNRLALLLIRRQCQRVNQNISNEEETIADINKKAEQQGIAK